MFYLQQEVNRQRCKKKKKSQHSTLTLYTLTYKPFFSFLWRQILLNRELFFFSNWDKSEMKCQSWSCNFKFMRSSNELVTSESQWFLESFLPFSLTHASHSHCEISQLHSWSRSKQANVEPELDLFLSKLHSVPKSITTNSFPANNREAVVV